jgi:hypothetical protein
VQKELYEVVCLFVSSAPQPSLAQAEVEAAAAAATEASAVAAADCGDEVPAAADCNDELPAALMLVTAVCLSIPL